MDVVDQLMRDEGVRYRPYRDTRGFLTVGVGRNLDAVPFSKDEVTLMLENDVRDKVEGLKQFAWFAALDPVRQGAVVNMAFNLGLSGLLHFPHMLAALGKQDYETAATEMANSDWAKQVGDRATRLETQIRSGQWI